MTPVLPGAFGYLYLPALAVVACASVTMAPLGARAAHALDVAQLKRGLRCSTCSRRGCCGARRADETRRRRRGRGRRGGPVLRRSGRTARRARPADRPRREGRREDPHLRRRPLQLHEPRRHARAVPLAQPALRALGAGALHAAGFHRARPAPPHRLPREAPRPAVLRRLEPADHRPAAARMRGRPRRQAVLVAAVRSRGGARDGRASRRRPRRASSWTLARGPVEAARLVVATGGLPVPKIGATDFGLRLARQFGLAVVPPRPALVPLVFDAAAWAPFVALAGVSLEVGIAAGAGKQRAGRSSKTCCSRTAAWSGPAVLQASSFWQQASRWPRIAFLRPAPTGTQTLAQETMPRSRSPARQRTRAAPAATRLAQALALRSGGLPSDKLGCPRSPTSRLRQLAEVARALAHRPDRHRGLEEGRGDGRAASTPARSIRRRAEKPARPRTAFHRRSARRHRLAGRLQLPVGSRALMRTLARQGTGAKRPFSG